MKEKTKNILGPIIVWCVLLGGLPIYFLGIRNQVIKSRNYKSSAVFIEKGPYTYERPPLKVYIRTDHRYFYPGDILTSKESGALILWDTTMPVDHIVGIVSDSGTIEHYKPK